MWKLLRNLGLVTILLAGMVKLLAWYEVGQDAQRLVVALAPYAQVHYDSLSAGLDGSVRLSGVTMALKYASAEQLYRADSLVLESPSVFWLLKHALLGDNTLPPRFGVSAQGLKLPATPGLDPRWFNPLTLVPFETLGCGADAFAPADYKRMGVTVGDARQHLEYRYDANSKLLDLTLTMAMAAVAKLTLEAELRPFDPQSPTALEKLHVDQLSADYVDNGYLLRRNQFCAQRVSMDPKQFIERHIAAVQALLEQHRIQASSELVRLYRQMLDSGGRVSILSLPNNTFVVGAWSASTPQDLLRQLNVTARYGDSPPVMFRLSFAPPPDVEPDLLAAATPIPFPSTPAGVTPPSVPSAPAPAPVVVAPVKPATASVITPTSVAPPARPPPAAVPPAALGESPPKPSAVPLPPAVRAPVASPGLSNLDRAEAQLPAPPKPAASPAKPGAVLGLTEFPLSEPPPTAGSTLALVWKSTIERLRADPPEQQTYDVIDYARLKDEQGRRVRLVTDGGKKIEGYVLGVDDAGVALRINRGDVGGDVQFVIPKARIRQIQLLHRSLPPA